MKAGLGLETLANDFNYSKSSMARFETAESMIPPDLPPKLDEKFDMGEVFVNMYGLACKEIHPDQFKLRMEMEARARLIQEYCGQMVPGLMQTEDYARAMFLAYDPWATPEEVEELVAARMSRQAWLESDPPPEYSLILDEAALRRPFGGPAVMRAQLARLVALATTPALVQVVPFAFGVHGLVGGSLALMTLDDGTHVVWEEGISTGALHEERDAVMRLQRAYDRLSACALPPSESAAFIRDAMEALPA